MTRGTASVTQQTLISASQHTNIHRKQQFNGDKLHTYHTHTVSLLQNTFSYNTVLTNSISTCRSHACCVNCLTTEMLLISVSQRSNFHNTGHHINLHLRHRCSHDFWLVESWCYHSWIKASFLLAFATLFSWLWNVWSLSAKTDILWHCDMELCIQQ